MELIMTPFFLTPWLSFSEIPVKLSPVTPGVAPCPGSPPCSLQYFLGSPPNQPLIQKSLTEAYF